MIPEQGIVLDAGTAMFRLADHLATRDLDIFLSHAHLDHVVGLTYLLGILYGRDMRRVTVHGVAEKLAAIDKHLFAEPLFPVRPDFDYQPLVSEVALSDKGRLTHFPLQHPGGAVGYRLDWPGHSMAYVTDTTATAESDYLDQIRGVDVLVHECFFSDAQSEWAAMTGHSSTTPVATIARDAEVGRLVLVHMNPSLGAVPIELAAARKIFSTTDIGYDGMEINF
jgi:ribonuclease BN (tRNA processing enzyme)